MKTLVLMIAVVLIVSGLCIHDVNTPNRIDASSMETVASRREIYSFSDGTYSVLLSNVTSEFVVNIGSENIRSDYIERQVEGPTDLQVVDGVARLIIRSDGNLVSVDYTNSQKLLSVSIIFLVAGAILFPFLFSVMSKKQNRRNR